MPKSHKPRRRYIPKRADPDSLTTAVMGAARLEPRERANLVNPMRSAFAHLRQGTGGEPAWCQLADALNVGERLALRGIASDRVPEILAAQQALAELYNRHSTARSWTLRGSEIAALSLALEICEIQLELCSLGELVAAVNAAKEQVSQAVAGNASPRARVLVAGALGNPQLAAP